MSIVQVQRQDIIIAFDTKSHFLEKSLQMTIWIISMLNK